MREIPLTPQQVAMLDEIAGTIAELQRRSNAMLDIVVAGAGEEPGPVEIERRPDGVYLVRPEKS